MALPTLGRRIESLQDSVENFWIGRFWKIPQAGEGSAKSPKSGQIGLTPQALGHMLGIIGRQQMRVVNQIGHEFGEVITRQGD